MRVFSYGEQTTSFCVKFAALNGWTISIARMLGGRVTVVYYATKNEDDPEAELIEIPAIANDIDILWAISEISKLDPPK